MEGKSSVLNDLFVSREENICALTEYDNKRIKELTKENDYKIGFIDAMNLIFECMKQGI